jgi:hypothetical protein
MLRRSHRRELVATMAFERAGGGVTRRYCGVPAAIQARISARSAVETQPAVPGAPLQVSAGMLPAVISRTMEFLSLTATLNAVFAFAEAKAGKPPEA